MSVIFDAMLVTHLGERDAIAHVNRALYDADSARHQQFEKCAMRDAGGTKVFCTDVYAAAFNHLIPDVVQDAICAAPWRYPEDVLYIEYLGDYHYDESSPLSSRTAAELRSSRSEH